MNRRRFRISLKWFLLVSFVATISIGWTANYLMRPEVVGQANVPVYPGLQLTTSDADIPTKSLGNDWNYLYVGNVNDSVLNRIVDFYKEIYPDAETSDWSESSGLYFKFSLKTNHPSDVVQIKIWDDGLVQIQEYDKNAEPEVLWREEIPLLPNAGWKSGPVK